MEISLTILSLVLILVTFSLFSLIAKAFRGSKNTPLRSPPTILSFDDFLEVKVSWVVDGDTVDVIDRGRKVRVRLSAIDCPENGQEFSDKAMIALIGLIGGKQVFLETHGLDFYGRTVATIYVQKDSDIINVNEKMVMCGHAWVMRRYYNHLPSNRRRNLNTLERWAKNNRVGLWKSANPVPPWRWRNKKAA